ncbi:ferric reductase-like transmembrane domain-containing protein [Anthocerotibacter panamensis]|uniref:ferric reductase-like transmembrane domain-containing protein n=1 Tax=Anthocerotibacter panamensis TaxID=2857077 RepID=UPI001C404301|nr:ferric reductase-like transmembrane domain-containing protein [Anthocerotibacter panamensis]
MNYRAERVPPVLSSRHRIRDWTWFVLTMLLGSVWVYLVILPFINPSDHLWQQEVTQYQGNLALFCLGIILYASGLSRWLPAIVKDRRWLGLMAFGLAVAHTISGFKHTLGGDWQGWQFLGPLEQGALGIGVLSLLLLTVLALTSNNWSVQTLGKGWKVLHRSLFYPAVILALLHTAGLGVHFRWSTPQGLINLLLVALTLVGALWLRRTVSPR